jgi:hypothetical protein
MCKRFIAVLGILAVSAVGQATADTLLNTIGSDPFVGGGYSVGQNLSLALQFSAGGDSLVTGVEAYIPSGLFQLGLMPDSAGLPSGTFVAGDVVTISTSGPGPVNLTSLNWSITPGSFYWLVGAATPPNSGGFSWQFSSTATNVSAVDDGGWAPFGPTPNFPPEAIVIGSAASTPLAPAFPLFATGLGGLGLLGWRRKRKAQAVA